MHEKRSADMFRNRLSERQTDFSGVPQCVTEHFAPPILTVRLEDDFLGSKI